MKLEALSALVQARAQKKAAVLFTPLPREPERAPAKPGEPPPPIDTRPAIAWIQGEGELPDELRDAAHRALATDDAFTIETDDGPLFVQPINPPLRLFVVGAVHIAEPLARTAAQLGYEVMIIDPREAFARAERWPGVTVRNDWPDDVLSAASLDHRAAVVTLTHDPKIDDPALESALKSPVFYIGALGSGKTHGSRLRRLGERGFEAGALARIHGPVGLRIGARTPGEIAISILAQMTEVLRKGDAAKTDAKSDTAKNEAKGDAKSDAARTDAKGGAAKNVEPSGAGTPGGSSA